LLGQFEFSDFQRGARGEVEIDVTFEINTDGIVNVTASDKKTGRRTSTRITLSSGLSEREIKDIIDRGVAGRVQTAATAAAPSASVPAAAAKVRTPAAPKPAAARAPSGDRIALIDDDALIPIPESDLVDSDATTQPELEAEHSVAPIRANEVELSEEDLAELDTSDLDIALDGESESLFDKSGVDLSADDAEPSD
jgi:hypothetical protein